MLLSGDHARLQKLLGTLQLGLRDLESGSRDVQVRHRLVERVPDISRIYLRQESPRLYLITDVDVKPKNLPRCLGLDLHLADGLHRAGRLRRDHQVSAEHRRGLNRRCVVHTTVTTTHHEGRHQYRTPRSHAYHICAPMCSVRKSLAIVPSCR